MKIVWKLLLLLAVITLVVVAAFAYAAPSQGLSPEVLRPLMAACVVFAGGCALGSGNAAFTKRHTTATGF
jgi:hypothetical protein